MSKDDTALARRDGPGLPDAYERKYMAGDGLVLHRDRMVAGKKFNGFLLAVGAFMVGFPLAMGAPLTASLPAVGVLGLVWVLLGVLRTTVSEGAVNVKYGFFGPKIPMTAIEGVFAIDYDWKAFGGWGIRRGRDGWMYNMLGDGGRAVRIEWRTKKGSKKVTFIGTRGADELARAIEAACQRMLPAGQTQAAIEASDDPDTT